MKNDCEIFCLDGDTAMSRTTERQASIFVVSLINLDEGAAVSGVGLAVDGHAPHLGEGRGQVLELGHSLAAANLLSDVLCLAVVLGHAVEKAKNERRLIDCSHFNKW